MSPAVSIAVISELKIKNRLADLVLGMAVAKDVVMIVMLATAMSVAGLLAPESQGFDVAVFKELGTKVALSLGAGVVLGGALIAWLRYVGWEMVLLLLLLGYGGTDLAETLHLKPLLVFIGAGFTVANFSPYGHDLHEPQAGCRQAAGVLRPSVPVSILAAVAVAPVVGILFVARLCMLALATRLGGRLAGEPPGFTGRTWPTFVSQAGVALGLLLIARDALPQYDVVLSQVGTVLVGCNLLIGPILLRISLMRPDKAAAIDTVGEGAETTAGGQWTQSLLSPHSSPHGYMRPSMRLKLSHTPLGYAFERLLSPIQVAGMLYVPLSVLDLLHSIWRRPRWR